MTSLESDPVVRSYEVFVSQALNEQLYLLQYPTRPAYLPFNPNQLDAARVKPKQMRVQLEYQVPVPNNPARFCPIRAQQQALDHSSDHLETHPPSYTLTSESGEGAGNRYAVAVLKDRSLHLNPLQAVIQLRPEVRHLEEKDELVIKQEDETEELTEDIVPLQMRVARPSTNQIRASQRKKEREQLEESWVPLSYNHFDSGTANYLRSLLFGNVEGEQTTSQIVTNEEYVEHLAQVSRTLDPPNAPADTQIGLERSIRNKPIKEQLLHTLRKTAGHCVKFSFIQNLLGNQFSPENLLKTLELISMLVQGWFVLNSSELYPPYDPPPPGPMDPLPPGSIAPLPPGQMDPLPPGQMDPLEVQRGRDYILCHYALYKGLNKQDAFQLLKLPTRQFNEVFGALSSFHLRDKHCFKYAEDSIFINEHPTMCKRHQQHWNEVYGKIQAHFKLELSTQKEIKSSHKERHTSKKTTSPAEIVSDGLSSPLPKKPRQNTSTIEPSTVRQLLGHSPMPLYQLKKNVFKIYKEIKHENKALENLFNSPDLFDEVMHTILQEINAAVIQFPASSDSKNSIIVVARETGSSSDVFRMALISSLENNPSQRRAELLSGLKETVGSVPEKNKLDKILDSICSINGGFYRIKGLEL